MKNGNPNIVDRAKAAWDGFFNGFSSSGRTGGMIAKGIKAAISRAIDSPFRWSNWRDNKPQWNHYDFAGYVSEGFMANSLVYAAIMYKARSKSSAPLRAYTGDPQRPDRLPPDHPLSKLVARPNPHQSWIEFQMLNEIFFNFGNSFVLLVRPEGGGLPRSMYSLRPDRVRIIPKSGAIAGYAYVPEGGTIESALYILPEDMMHVKLPNPADPLEGLGWGMPPEAIAQSVDVDNDVTRFLKLFFQNGAMPLGILKFDTPMEEEDMDAVKERWHEMYGGVDNWSEIGVLDQGGQFQRVGSTFSEMGFAELDERNESRILGPLGVPPILIGTRTGLNRSTYSNYETARRTYWEDTAIPEIRLFEDEYSYFLQTDDGGFVLFDTSDVPALKAEVKEFAEAALKLWQMGIPANKATAAVGLSNLVGDIPGGDVAYISKTLQPVGVDIQDDSQSNQGAVEAEDDTRKATDVLELIMQDTMLRDALTQALKSKSNGDLELEALPTSPPPVRTEIDPTHTSFYYAEAVCPICANKGIDLYLDHKGLAVCRTCLQTFDPAFYNLELEENTAEFADN